MVDTLICFSCPQDRAEEFLVSLQRDFYKQNSPFAVGTPFFRDYNKEDVLFFCPMVIPVLADNKKIRKQINRVRRFIHKNKSDVVLSGIPSLIWIGWFKSAEKGNIKLKLIEATEELKSEYDEYFQKNL